MAITSRLFTHFNPETNERLDKAKNVLFAPFRAACLPDWSPTNGQKMDYLEKRKKKGEFFSYGLKRRLAVVQEEFSRFCAERTSQGGELAVADFGCADAAMLDAMIEDNLPSIKVAFGFDMFASGIPETRHSNVVNLIAMNLFHDLPCELPDNSVDFAIISAFIKHNPDPVKFISEVSRLLKPGGRAIFLDPCKNIVRFGIRMGYFEARYTPSPWGLSKFKGWLRTSGSQLSVESYRRYWLSPKEFLWKCERLIPKFLRNRIGLHQCLVLSND